jgi:DNA primase
LRFALLPEGQDPDDLVRRAGPEAMQEVLDSAQPLSAMLWQRETESANLETPERRAALEARLSDLLHMIQDETVRRHYRDELGQRLRRLFSPGESGPSRLNQREAPGRRRAPPSRGQFRERGSRLAASTLVRGHLAAVPAREALILVAVINHPWLLADHAEALAELEFAHRDAEALRRALLEAAAAGVGDTETLTIRVEEVGAGPALASIKRAITHAADWPVRPDAAAEDVARFWHQIATLQVKKRTLSKELREAERALGSEPSEANFAKLKDVQNRLAALDGTEALIEGFGEPSGRPARTM